MALTELEIRKISKSVVDEAKRTARYDQGTLYRSISYTIIRGVVHFRQIFYGVYHGNSKLEEIARRKMPKGVAYNIILTDFNGIVKEVGKTKSGRSTQKTVLRNIKKTSLGSVNIRALIARNKVKKIKDAKEIKDGEEE